MLNLKKKLLKTNLAYISMNQQGSLFIYFFVEIKAWLKNLKAIEEP